MKELARAHTVEAIETLVAMLQAESERTRVAAAEALLSRGWGRNRCCEPTSTTTTIAVGALRGDPGVGMACS